MKVFNDFLSKFYPNKSFENCSLETVIMFISFLYKEGRSPNTITSYIGGLSYLFQLKGNSDYTSHFLVKKSLCGARRLSAGPDLRKPITLEILKHLVAALPCVCSSFYQQKLMATMFLMAFHAFLRIGEITVRSKSNPNLLTIEDVTLLKDKKSTAVFYSKNGQFQTQRNQTSSVTSNF